MDEYEFLDLVAMFERHGIEPVSEPEAYGNLGENGFGSMGFVGMRMDR